MMIGLLSPEGHFYSCDSYGYLSLARELTEHLFKKDLIYATECEDFLLEKNFIVFQARNVYKKIINEKGKCYMTKQQLDFINNNNKSFNDMQKKDISRMLLEDSEHKEIGSNYERWRKQYE